MTFAHDYSTVRRKVMRALDMNFKQADLWMELQLRTKRRGEGLAMVISVKNGFKGELFKKLLGPDGYTLIKCMEARDQC
jgi:hypothetical protein